MPTLLRLYDEYLFFRTRCNTERLMKRMLPDAGYVFIQKLYRPRTRATRSWVTSC